MMNRIISFLLAVTFACVARAGDVPAWNVRAELQIIRLPERDGLPLALRWADPANCQTALEETQRLIADGKATFIANLIAHATESKDGSAEQIDEVRYPTGFANPDARLLSAPNDGSKSLAAPPTEFAKRYCGITFVGKFSEPDGLSPRLMASAVHTWRARTERFDYAVSKDGTKLHVEWPVVPYLESRGCVPFRDGRTILLGTHLLTEPQHIIELHLLTAHATRKPKPGQAFAQPVAHDEWLVDCELHKFVVPEPRALAVRATMIAAEKVEGAFADLVASTIAGETELAACTLAHEFSSQRANSETTVTRAHPMEFPYAHDFGSGINLPILAFDPKSPPSCFEYRHDGHTFEAEALALEDGRLAEIKIEAQSTHSPSFSRWLGGTDRSRVNSFWYQPNTTYMKTSTNITLASGQRRLIAFHKVPLSDGRYELTFLKATTTRIAK